jgi:hypothetical protein
MEAGSRKLSESSSLPLRLRDAALSCRMAAEVQPIDAEDLKVRVRELRRFL